MEHCSLHPAPWEAAACAGRSSLRHQLWAPGRQQCPLVRLHLLGFGLFSWILEFCCCCGGGGFLFLLIRVIIPSDFNFFFPPTHWSSANAFPGTVPQGAVSIPAPRHDLMSTQLHPPGRSPASCPFSSSEPCLGMTGMWQAMDSWSLCSPAWGDREVSTRNFGADV